MARSPGSALIRDGTLNGEAGATAAAAQLMDAKLKRAAPWIYNRFERGVFKAGTHKPFPAKYAWGGSSSLSMCRRGPCNTRLFVIPQRKISRLKWGCCGRRDNAKDRGKCRQTADQTTKFRIPQRYGRGKVHPDCRTKRHQDRENRTKMATKAEFPKK